MVAGEAFSPVELDFLWESIGAGEPPYPLELRSHGATMDERAALRRETLDGLAARGLVDRAGRPVDHLEGWFGVLSGAESSVDAVLLNEADGEPVLAIACRRGGSALLAVQDGNGTRMGPVSPDGLAGAIVGLLPPAPRGAEKSITVPLEQLLSGTGVDFLQRRAAGGRASADEDRRALARLHAQPRLRGGQLGANARARTGGRTRPPVLSWFDTETGRYFTQASKGRDGRDWITIAPADAASLRHRLAEMLAAAEATPAPL